MQIRAKTKKKWAKTGNIAKAGEYGQHWPKQAKMGQNSKNGRNKKIGRNRKQTEMRKRSKKWQKICNKNGHKQDKMGTNRQK